MRNFFKYLSFFAIFFVLANASILGVVFPFAVGFALALLWCRQNPLIVLSMFLLACLVVDFSAVVAVGAGVFCVAMLLALGVHRRIKKPISLSNFVVYGAVYQVGYLFANYYFSSMWLYPLLSAVLAVVFFLVCRGALMAILVKQSLGKLSPEVCTGALVFVGALACGFQSLSVFSVPLLNIFAVFVLLVACSAQSVSTSVMLATALGFGACLSAGNSAFLLPFVAVALASAVPKGAHKTILALCAIGAVAVLGYGMGVYAGFSNATMIATVVGALGFCLIPSKKLQVVGQMFVCEAGLGENSVVNTSRNTICKRLGNLAEAFNEMDYIFRSFVKGGLGQEQAKGVLVAEVKDKVCADCAERNICHRKNQNQTSSVLEGLISTALVRGRATILDAPSYLTTRCGRVPMIAGAINTLAGQYKQYSNTVSSIDASRMLVADELRGMSGMLKNLAEEVGRNISFDKLQEKRIITELSLFNIVCVEAVVYQQNLCVTSATLVVKKTDSARAKIPEVVGKICKCKMAVAEIVSAPHAGWDIVTLKTAPKFSLAFGTATLAKHGSATSGDAYSVIKIQHDKYLLALCDGMGSGEKAEKTSSLAIGLIENFYRAGFDSEIILSSINKLLSLSADESFNALDICVLDTQNGTADFVKMGAPQSFLKHSKTTDVVAAEALPLGIVAEAQPVTIRQIIDAGDFVVMCTDGVADSFETDAALVDFVNNQPAVNPQLLAENLLAKALQHSGGAARDDMTVIVAKIFLEK